MDPSDLNFNIFNNKRPSSELSDVDRNNILAPSAQEYFRLNVYIPFLDHVLSQMRERFSNHNMSVLQLSALIPSFSSKYEFESLKPVISMYSKFLPGSEIEILGEYQIWKNIWEKHNEPPTDAIKALNHCDQDLFPNLHILLRILCTIPVTTSTPERTFSVVKRLKTYLSSTMRQDQLTGLAHLHIHREFT